MMTPTMMITSMITTATTMMAGMVDSLPVGCALLLTGVVALGLAAVVSNMVVPLPLLTVACPKNEQNVFKLNTN